MVDSIGISYWNKIMLDINHIGISQDLRQFDSFDGCVPKCFKHPVSKFSAELQQIHLCQRTGLHQAFLGVWSQKPVAFRTPCCCSAIETSTQNGDITGICGIYHGTQRKNATRTPEPQNPRTCTTFQRRLTKINQRKSESTKTIYKLFLQSRNSNEPMRIAEIDLKTQGHLVFGLICLICLTNSVGPKLCCHSNFRSFSSLCFSLSFSRSSRSRCRLTQVQLHTASTVSKAFCTPKINKNQQIQRAVLRQR